MERIQISVPNPLKREFENFREEEGYESDSAAGRELLRLGLDQARAGNTLEDVDAVLGAIAGSDR